MRDVSDFSFDSYFAIERVLWNIHLDDFVAESSSDFFQGLLFSLSVSMSVRLVPLTTVSRKGRLRIIKVDDKKVYSTTADEHIVVVFVDILKGTGACFGD